MSEHDWVKAHGDISTCSRCGAVTQTDGSYDDLNCPGLDVSGELARLQHERDLHVQLSESLKLALRMPGTGNYVEWAKECRNAMDELARLRAPSAWSCPMCGFVLNKRVIYAQTGEVGVNDADESELCPNDGATMRRVTWEEECKKLDDANIALLREERSLRARDEAARELFGFIDDLDFHDEDTAAKVAELRLRFEEAGKNELLCSVPYVG